MSTISPLAPFRAPFRSRDTVLSRTGIITVSNAELLALFGTPKTLVPAPGADLVALPEYAILHKPAGTAYTVPGTSELALRFTDASGTILGQCETTGFLDQATVQPRLIRGYRAASAASDITPVANAAIVLHTTVANVTAGAAPLYVQVYYRILRVLILP